MKIEGAVALVTGGASGIGKAICEKLLQGGAKVQFLDINKTTGEETLKSLNNQHANGRAKFICCDVTSQDQLEAAFRATVKEHGRLDILVNNAGVLDEQDWEKTLNVNLHAVIRSTFLGIELMKNGVIINMSSTGGIHPVSFAPTYCASKFGVMGFSRSVAPTAVRKKGIRVNCVCPGSTDTDIYKSVVNLELTREQQELLVNTHKQKPEAVAQCIVDLIKDESTEAGQVVKVTYEDGVEYLNFNDIII
ncbi:15-hydroxyprostaglandin dehydrogenase [NAD(+)] [Stylophora pistillata]|uniref:15-hydroxyprostaglandin dehydrogenase [NAD(+)] n=1 Tax=Stylophora pistillata TaxID=50429 RepID=A0A2B4SHJ7_STYPI|nr:15-hydroxyprostaglandin dehydrogenase [NAD(+)] [Stylophora pistillata]